MQYLAILFFLPFLFSAAILVFPFGSRINLKRAAIFFSLVPLIVLLLHSGKWVDASLEYDWFTPLLIVFFLRVDALSLLFIYLVAFITPIALASSRSRNLAYPKVFYSLILFLQGLLIGFFTARDLAVFTVFWEAMLLPLYFIIALWGGPERRAAAIRFIIYMLAGSALLVASVLSLYFFGREINGRGSFNLDYLSAAASHVPYAGGIFAVFLLAFFVKTPLFPFHSWLPDAYCQASTAGTILLAAILSKAGIYGILRIGLELFPDLMKAWSPWLLGFAVAGVLYGGLAAWQQNDFKRLIAYSSFSHVNFILAGLFVMNRESETGAILQTVNHSVTITGLFLVSGWLEERIGSTAIARGGGLALFMPKLCWLTMLFVLSSVGVPGLNNFIGELLILLGLFKESPFASAFLALSVILAVLYMLKWMQKVYFEESGPYQNSWIDLKKREIALAAPLVLCIFWIGLYPAFFLKRIEPPQSKHSGTQSETLA